MFAGFWYEPIHHLNQVENKSPEVLSSGFRQGGFKRLFTDLRV
jgi:hypothetical protein